MKLTKVDREILLGMRVDEKDFPQIEKALGKTRYMLTVVTSNDEVGHKEKRITATEAINILGKKCFLSGIARSAFHWDAVRTSPDEKQVVYFNSSRLFRS